jgi:hypothetical protein
MGQNSIGAHRRVEMHTGNASGSDVEKGNDGGRYALGINT